MRRLWTPFTKGVAGGLAGLVIGLLIWHLWVDHRSLHQMIGLLNAAQAQAAQAGKH